jgi:tetratricopeptide (TPR) repeat protein
MKLFPHVVAVSLIASSGTTQSLASESRVEAARDAVRRAELAMAEQRYEEAAIAMEEAYRHDPNPLWLANAGYARMLAGQQDRAIEILSRALSDTRLEGQGRERAIDRLARASAARAHVARSEEARVRDDFTAMARAYDNAFESAPVGLYQIQAARAWERAGALDIAEARYRAASVLNDVTPAQRAEIAEALGRIAQRASGAGAGRATSVGAEAAATLPRIESGSGATTWGWVLVGTGLAGAGLALGGFLASDGKQNEWNEAPRNELGQVLMSQKEAESLESAASQWRTVGVVSSVVAGVSLIGGIVLLATSGDSPETRESVHMGGGLSPGGGLVSATARF